jgi:hypothetical protein
MFDYVEVISYHRHNKQAMKIKITSDEIEVVANLLRLRNFPDSSRMNSFRRNYKSQLHKIIYRLFKEK